MKNRKIGCKIGFKLLERRCLLWKIITRDEFSLYFVFPLKLLQSLHACITKIVFRNETVWDDML